MQCRGARVIGPAEERRRANREAVRAHDNDMTYKVQLGRALATPLRADYHRLRAILSRLES